MKKLVLLLVLAVSFMACEGPTGPRGPSGMDGRDGEDGYGTNWFAKSFTIQPNQWELIGEPGELNSYFVVDKELPELTRDIYKERAVIAYVQTGDKVKNGMPYVLHQGGVDTDGKELTWTQTYDFDYSEGWVGFYVTYSDFNTQIKPVDPVTFHIILMW
ncbi:MAG: hypothetical protein LUH22_18420 [Bacteroides sp.]|nr:hypothetical protein [Bacteroides sp.]